MLEACWLHHNKNSKWLKQFVLGWPWCWPFQSVVKKTKYFDEQRGKVKRLSPKTVRTIFLSGICYLLNLLNGSQNPARNPASCEIENFPANSEKTPLNLAAKQLKLQHCSCYCIKLIKIKRFVTSQKRLWPEINFLMWKWPATLKRLGRPALLNK